jgi:hypothetical protein
MKTSKFVSILFLFSSLLSACTPGMSGPQSSPAAIGQTQRRGVVQSGDTIYETMPGSTMPDFTRPVRKLQPGETLDLNASNSTAATPHAQTLEEGEALENQMAKEAEEKVNRDQDPSNQAKKSIDDLERQVQEEQEKVEGSSN